MNDLYAHANAFPFRDLAIGRLFGNGFVVFVRGEVLRSKRGGRPHNERVFSSEEAALKAGMRAR